MFKVTQKLADYAVKNLSMPSHFASDITKNRDAIAAHITKSIDDGSVKFSTIAKLADDTPRTGEDIVRDAIGEAMAPMAKAMGDIAHLLGGRGSDGYSYQPYGSGAGAKAYAAHASASQETSSDEVRVRVKSVAERFDNNRKMLQGQTKSMNVPALENSVARSFEGVSELDKAVAGATLKHLVNRGSNGNVPAWAKMTDLDRSLMQYAAHELPWVGPLGMRGDDDDQASLGWVKGGRLQGIQIKSVLDDVTSGGLEAVPVVFDDLAVLTPLLMSELLPLVDQRVTSRRRVEGFKVANPTMYWTAEGTAPTEFSTTGFVSEFNTNIHPCVGWMEIGLDFEDDSPVGIANLIISNYARKAANELENKIASGSGTGEPLGLVNTPSAIAVASTNDAAGPPTVSDYEALLFAIPKEYRQEAGNRLVYVSNDTSYKRARGIQIGTSDQRRIFGGNGQNYVLNDLPFKINHTIDDGTIMAACMNRYVLYRRAGFQVRRVTESSDLAKKNMEMLVVRMRYGGQMSDGNALALMEDAQSGT